MRESNLPRGRGPGENFLKKGIDISHELWYISITKTKGENQMANIIKYERVELSEKEMEAFALTSRVVQGIWRETDDPNLRDICLNLDRELIRFWEKSLDME